MVRTLTRMNLERAGYTVLTAENGAQAVTLFEEHGEAIDMAILDVLMPELGGREAYEQMRARRHARPQTPLQRGSAASRAEDTGPAGAVIDARTLQRQYPDGSFPARKPGPCVTRPCRHARRASLYRESQCFL